MSEWPILVDLTITPNAAKNAHYRWCDYVELRCLAHPDHRFSRDGLQEALTEANGLTCEVDAGYDEYSDVNSNRPVSDESLGIDRHEEFAALCFRRLRWREELFGDQWPFTIDQSASEIQLKSPSTDAQYFYLQLLLSSTLEYCHKRRMKELTVQFENVSFNVFKNLMPVGSEVHIFGAAHSTRFKGNLYQRLLNLATCVHGELRVKESDFTPSNAGDGGLDIVAWHNLGDSRDNIPIAFAQCGCTASGWPTKMLESSPTRLGNQLIVGHEWATYYFMPLELADVQGDQVGWQQRRGIGRVIVIDRLRLLRLSNIDALKEGGMLIVNAVDEAVGLAIS